jgi:YbbR domain-containing protein
MTMATEQNKPRTTGLKIISVALAVLLWFYVMSQGQLSARQNVMDVELQYAHLSEGLTVEGPATVSVRLWGVFREPDQIEAFVDMTDLGEGTYNLPVHVKPVSGAMLTRVEPDRIDVVVRKTRQHVVAIDYEIVQNPPAGSELLDIFISPGQCLVKGEDKAVAQVSTVVCQVNLSQASEVAVFNAPLIARDVNGNLVKEGIRLVPEHVQVAAVIQETIEYKAVPLKPNLVGQLEEGLQLGNIKLEPDTITVVGNTIRIQPLTEIQTDPINLEGRKESFVEKVPITLPPGLQGYPEQVELSVEIIGESVPEQLSPGTDQEE